MYLITIGFVLLICLIILYIFSIINYKDNINNKLDNFTNINNIKKYYKKSITYPKCLKFEKELINKIINILDNKELKTKDIVKQLNENYNIKILKEDLNKGVLKWMLCRKLIKYNKKTFMYYK